ncbi:MAG: glycoside hydrolase family 9 protein [Ruminococcus sp.]|uniref:glycoside hydrolase family 9 protein n=1 Tax=Ruminococcus sp. TaxID=41978 RepID=UPI0025E22C5B|nr:glycoside hydrolase family 9 protein [Ruminococcus sp.]MCR4795513.1 glycoside hydrolase family 9 protein [Ruminococcus sp.]
MHKLNRFKSALIGGAVALTSLAAPFTSMVAPSLSATAADSDNYAKLLQYSLYFYDANMCGDNSDCAISWRGNCHMNDDVPGGFHDAGDHVMFGQPQGYAASTLGWSYYEFKDAYEATGQGAHLKVITDKFAKFFREATKLNGNTVSQVLIEKGEGDIDHSYWGAPENQNGRGRMLWVSGGAANVTAEYAAALAANYVNFGNTEDLKYAKALYEFSKKDTGYYSAGTFYDAHWTGSSDEMAWAAGWLYLATKDQGYLNDLKNCPTAYSVHSWESVQLGAAILKGEITGDWGSAAELGKFQGNNYYFANEWGSARHNATAQLCSLVAAKYNKADSSWAKGQMEYLTGDKAFANGQTHCLVVGFKSNSSKNPHHRAASPNADASKQNDGTPNANLLVGALCGGPLDANGTYQDIRSDYQGNEVAVDYNAGFVGAAAGLYHFYKTGSIEKSIPGVTKIYSGSSTPGPSTPTVTTTQYNPGTPTVTTTQYNPGTPSTNDDDIVLTGSSLNAKKEESQTDGAINNVAEFKPQGAKSVTMYLKVNSNDTEVSGGFGTWTGEWEQEEFSGVKVGADKTVAIDYKVPSNVGATIKAMVWWPHDDDVTIEKIVLHKSGSSTPSVQTTTTKTNPPVVTTTTKYNPSTPSTNGKDIVLEGSSLNAKKEESQTDGAINNVAEFKPQGAKSVTMYLKVNSSDTEVSGGFGTWTGEWEQEEFSGVKVGSDKTVAIDYKVPSNVGATIKAMVWWPHDDDVTIEKIVLHMDGSSTPTVEKTTTTTKRVTTTTQRVTTTTTTAPVVTQPYVVTDPPLDPTILGDANNDGTIDLSDAVIIMQALANPNKYGVEGTDRHHISAQGWTNADVHKRGNGVTSNDALAIQKYLLGLVMLPTDNV